MSNFYGERFSTSDNELSSLKDEMDSLESAIHAYSFGFICGKSLNPKLTLQGGLGFSKYGYVIDTLSTSGIVDMRFKYKYLEVPVSAVYALNENPKFQPILSFGVFGGFLIGQKTEFDIIGSSASENFSTKEEIQKFNAGLNVSFGFQRQIEQKFKIKVEANYRQSFTSLSDTPVGRYLYAVGLNLSLIRGF